jgi:formylglycine-generating enzyme required for sulfatase activity
VISLFLKATGSVALSIAWIAVFTQPLSDSLRIDLPEMVRVEGGTFRMGSVLAGSDEVPVHLVTVDDFMISRYEITQKQWRDVMGNDARVNYFPGCDSCPVERVTWFSVQEYLEKLNVLSGGRFRLPTEAEWEYAARGGRFSGSFKYAGSNNPDEVAWRDGNSDVRTHVVGLKNPNELGLYDMSGNVWEWCSDWYAMDYYTVSPQHNPQGPVEGRSRVMRGGSWFHDSSGLRTTDRDRSNPYFRFGYVGFRICSDERQ